MNLSATYNLLPDYSQHPAGIQPRVHYPLSKPENAAKLFNGSDMQRSGRDGSAYKYYVLSDTGEMVYTRRKNMEPLFSSMKGSIVNLYV